jgi:hypothetical protein
MLLIKFTNEEFTKVKNTPYTEQELALISANKTKKVEETPELKAIYFIAPDEAETDLFNLIYNSYLPELNDGESFELIECVMAIETAIRNKGSIEYYIVSEAGSKSKKTISWDKFLNIENEV